MLSFISCNTDSPTGDYDDLGGADRTTRLYKVLVPEPTDRGGISASPNSAKLGAAVIVNYVPPEPLTDEDGLPLENAQNGANYTIISLTGSYNDGHKTVSIVKIGEGGGGDLSSPCPTRTYI
jgi:hypothetical protein